MPSNERGLYEPSDDVRVFDAAEEEEEEEGSRLPLLIVLALLVLAMFGGVVYLSYKVGVDRGRTEPRVITADAGPAKVAPTEAQGGETPNQGLKIYEQPAPSEEESEPAESALVETRGATGPAPVAELTPQPSPPPVAVKPPPAKPVEAAPVKPAPVTVAPIPVPPKPVAPPPTVASAPPRSLAPSASAGAYMLQVGAFKSQGDADAAWRAYQAKNGALLSGYGPDVKQVDLGEKGTWYRLRVGGFADKNAASALCDKLKANGSSCILATR